MNTATFSAPVQPAGHSGGRSRRGGCACLHARASRADAAGEELIVADYGGVTTEVSRRSFYQPFQAATGVKVTEATTTGFAQLKAMVLAGNVQWDIVSTEEQNMYIGGATGLLLELIYYSCRENGRVAGGCSPAPRRHQKLLLRQSQQYGEVLLAAEVMGGFLGCRALSRVPRHGATLRRRILSSRYWRTASHRTSSTRSTCRAPSASSPRSNLT